MVETDVAYYEAVVYVGLPKWPEYFSQKEQGMSKRRQHIIITQKARLLELKGGGNLSKHLNTCIVV